MQILNQNPQVGLENRRNRDMIDNTIQTLQLNIEQAQKLVDAHNELVTQAEDLEEKFRLSMEREALIQQFHSAQYALAEHTHKEIKKIEAERENQIFIRPR